MSAVHEVERLLPFPLVGLDSDNGSEFINHHLYRYCRSKGYHLYALTPLQKERQRACGAEELVGSEASDRL